MNAITDALRRKYKSPADALRALGIPQSVLYGRHALDEELEEPKSPEERLHRILAGKLSPEEMKAVGELLAELAASKEEPEEEPEENEASEHDAYEDDPVSEDDEADDIPEGRRAEKIDGVVTKDLDRPQAGKTAMDAAAKNAFHVRYPGAARIVSRGLYAAIAADAAPLNSQTTAQRASLLDRIPNLRRVAA